jgi:3alpha(or 20beta)-hydroxysteroid dehydrogenase
MQMNTQGKSMRRLEGKVAIITRASEGQGAAIARRFVAEGAKVVIADTRRENAEAVAAELGDKGAFIYCDISEEASWATLVKETEKLFGGIDVLVNGGGINCTGLMQNTSVEQFMNLVKLNQLAPWLGMRAMIEPMSRRGGGAIVSHSSAALVAGLPGKCAYAGTKGALRAMSSIAARELGQYDIRVNSVLAAAVATELEFSRYTLEQLNEQCAGLPIPRIAMADEVASAFVFLASDESAYITGAEIVIDGGLTAAPLESPLLRDRVRKADRAASAPVAKT